MGNWKIENRTNIDRIQIYNKLSFCFKITLDAVFSPLPFFHLTFSGFPFPFFFVDVPFVYAQLKILSQLLFINYNCMTRN